MARTIYAAAWCVSYSASNLVLLWFFAGIIGNGVADRLPGKSAMSCTVAVLILIAAGLCPRLVPPPGNAHRGLGMDTAKTVRACLQLTLFTAVCRFALPLVSARFGALSNKPDVEGTALWFGIASFAGIAIRILPLFIVHAVPSADELLRLDHRRPVLYLRSFDRELKKVRLFMWTPGAINLLQNRGGFYLGTRAAGDAVTSERARLARVIGSRRSPLDEQMVFADAFRQVGPYIALGRPHEGFRDMDLGAAKKYVADTEWQGVVREWLIQCAAVVVEAGDSAGLGWEIEQVVKLVPPSHVLVVCPYTVEDYAAFVQVHSHWFPVGLPRTRPTSRLLVFGPGWQPRTLRNINFNASETLAPFFAQLALRTNVRAMR